jgi:hypothetical protein
MQVNGLRRESDEQFAHANYFLRLLCLFLLVRGAYAQSDLSADLVDLQKPGSPILARILASGNKKRIEFQAASGEGALVSRLKPSSESKDAFDVHISGPGKVIILNVGDKTSTILEPGQKHFFDVTWGNPFPGEKYLHYVFGHMGNAEDVCTEWVERYKSQRPTCKKSGYESVDGRRAVRYEISADGESGSVWIDTKLQILLRRKNRWTSTELRNVREGALSAKLFEIPDDYTLAPAALGGVIANHEPE